MALFKSRAQNDIATVQAKLAAAQEAEADAIRARDEAALAAALSTDLWAAEPHHEAVRRARERCELLEAALRAAEEAERQRKAQLQAEERKSQNRAIRQHLAALFKAATHYEEGERQRIAAFDRMVEAGEAIRKLLPLPAFDGFAASVGYAALVRDCEREANRQGVEMPNAPGWRRGAPGTQYQIGFQPLATPSLRADLERRLLGCYDLLTAKAPPPLPMSEPTPAKPKEPPPITAAPEPSPKPAPLSAHEWVNLNRKQAAADPRRE